MAPARAKKTVDVAEKFVSAPALEKTRKATASAKLTPQAVTPLALAKPARAVTPVAQAKPARPALKRSLPPPVQNDDDDNENDDDDDDDDEEETKVDAAPASTRAAAASQAPSATPRSLHDDFINLMKVQGLEKMATDAGLLKDGQFRDLKREWDSMNQSFLPLKKADASASLPFPTPTPKKKKAPRASAVSAVSEKGSKGLRHFSMKVCQKVEEKHVTSYNEVADELVHEFVTMRPSDSVYDEKNIRRRVYDALNVLMAMDIISKEKKEIRWRGLPSNAKQDLELLTMEKAQRLKSIEQKKQQLQELLLQQIALKNLVQRNQADATTTESRIALPFILVNTSKDTVIQCEMSEDRQDVFFNFSGPFEINDDSEILKRMELHKAAPADVKDLVPEKLLRYLPPGYLTKA